MLCYSGPVSSLEAISDNLVSALANKQNCQWDDLHSLLKHCSVVSEDNGIPPILHSALVLYCTGHRLALGTET
jgi:hypothetical protein